jgi:hypothetical protein
MHQGASDRLHDGGNRQDVADPATDAYRRGYGQRYRQDGGGYV